ncbi:DUF6759 domain-containing protein [Bergeyella sp. RCAD1439]|uniref:DUF6759 domain-containing protein n=1 Tax=Bergeyella anatis TaxID=3113737 RepID=UPI002E186E04|nr:DUF6759 domain-containing protein [Bergeyella sp. RCAD1439]
MFEKILFLMVVFFSVAFSAQNYTVEQVEKTTDPKVVANFVKNNPDHEKTPEFKRKLYAMINGGNSAVAKPKVEPINRKEVASQAKKGSGVSEKDQRTAEILTHLLNNNSNSRQAYLHIRNRSKCNLVLKISGKKFYNLTVPAQNDNYILLDKGKYTLTTSICDAKYTSVKEVNSDLEITLGSGK